MLSNDVNKFYWDIENMLHGSSAMQSTSDHIFTLFLSYSKGREIGKSNYELVEEVKGIIGEKVPMNLSQGLEAIYTAENVSDAEMADLCEHIAYDDRSGDRYFYHSSTSSLITDLVCPLLDIKPEDKVVDTCSGFGHFLVASAGYSRAKYGHIPSLFGYEINQKSALVSRVILALNHEKAEIQIEDSLKVKIPNFTKSFIEPPFGARVLAGDSIWKDENVPLFSNESEWVFTYSAIQAMDKSGRLAVLLPFGRLMSSTGEKIRRLLIEKNYIEGIIELPSGMAIGTNLKTALLIFSKNKESTAIKMVDGTKFVSEDSNRRYDSLKLDVTSLLEEYQKQDFKFSSKEIMDNRCNLAPTIYLSPTYKIEVQYPVKISDVAKVIVGSQYTVSHFKPMITEAENGYRILTSSDINDGIINFERLIRIDPDSKLDKFALQNGDVILTSKSSKVKIAVIDDLPSQPVIVTGGMIIIRPDAKKINPVFIKIFLSSEKGMDTLKGIQRGTAITIISGADLADAIISCPPIKEQNKVSARYSSLVNTYAGLEEQLNSTKEKIDHFYSDYLSEEE